MLIRAETAADRDGVRRVNELAFEHPGEADLVEALHGEGAVLVSLVAEIDGQIAGHILFSRMFIETAAGSIPAVALAPMAVLPEHQRRGIGQEMIRQGLDVLREAGERIVIVLGHREYYPKLGFSVEKAAMLEHPFPPDAYMAMELAPGSLAGIAGKVKYASAFGL